MVSALWKAAADGDLNHLKELLKDASHADIEVKDHTGVTPLIQAVKNGHVEVVKELIARGADPNSQGKPETYTQDPAILELLKAGGSQPTVNGHVHPPHTGTPGAPEAHSPDGGHHYDQNGAPPAPYPQPMPGYWYMPHGGAYPPYPYMPPPAEGMPPQQHPMQGYYPVPPPHPQGPPQPSQDGAAPQEPGHQQQNGSPTMHIPPDVARTIPCRYFPMCKYGASCMFLHPAAPYYNPAPPVPYPGYEAMSHPPSYAPHGYYGVPPPPQSFAPPPPPAVHATGGPQSPVQHTGGAPPPPHGVPFPVDGSVPPPPPQGAYPYPPPQIATPQSMPPPVTISPTAPYHPAPVVIPVQPPVSTYTSPVSPTVHRKESGSAINYPQQPPPGPAAVPPPASQANGFVENPVNGKPANNFGAGESEGRPHFQSGNGYRRGGFRKTSFNGPPRPPCAFFPVGKCKNGTECRFPHIRPEDDPAAFGPEGYPPQSFPQRNTRPQNNMRGGHGHGHGHGHGPRSFGPREDAQNGDANGQTRPHMTNGFRKHYPGSDFATRGFHNGGFRGGKFGGGGPGHHVPPVAPKEKVLSPADFPSLNGSSTPPATNGHVNGNGLTAAQVLKRNAPQTPVIKELAHEESLADAMSKVTINGHAKENGIKAPSRPESPDLPPPVFPSINDTVTSAAKLVAAA